MVLYIYRCTHEHRDGGSVHKGVLGDETVIVNTRSVPVFTQTFGLSARPLFVNEVCRVYVWKRLFA